MLTTEQRTRLALAGVPITVNQATGHKIYAEFMTWQQQQPAYDNLQSAYDSFLATIIGEHRVREV